MFASVCGKTPRDEGAAFVADTAVVVGDVTLKPGCTVWYGAVIRGTRAPSSSAKTPTCRTTPL